MRITAEKDRQAIKRYAHVRPARGWGVHVCGARCPGTSRTCTLKAGHGGPHVAHGFLRRVVAVWDEGPGEVRGSVARLRSSLEAHAPRSAPAADRTRTSLVARPEASLGARRSGGILEALRRGVPTLSSLDVEAGAFIALFFVAVGFVLYWIYLFIQVGG